jgi:hypothetical protein
MRRSLAFAAAFLALLALGGLATSQAQAYQVGKFCYPSCYPSYCPPCQQTYCPPSYCPPCQQTYCPPSYCPPSYCPPCQQTYCPPCYSGSYCTPSSNFYGGGFKSFKR